MTVYFDKRRQRWTFDFEEQSQRYSGYALDENGQPVTCRRDAIAARERERAKARMAPKLARGDEITLAQVAAALIPAWKRQARWENIRKYYLKEVLDFFGRTMPAAHLDDEQIGRYRAHCLQAKIKIWAGGPKRDPAAPENKRFWRDSGRLRGPETINLYLEILRAIVTQASKMRDPMTRELILPAPPAVREEFVPKRKARPVPEIVLNEALADLPKHTAEAAVLTLLFGFRKGEAFTLQIHHVDWEACGVRLFAEDVKDAEDTFLPAGPQAMAFLRSLRDQAKDRGVLHLVTYRPYRKAQEAQEKLKWLPIKNPKRAWGRVMDKAQEKYGRRWRWHDIRAAFITNVALTSGPMQARVLARHSDQATTDAYVEVADEMRRLAAERTEDRPALVEFFKAEKKRRA